MVLENDGQKLESRPPTISDLKSLCRELNRRGAMYVVIGGMAMIQSGFVRAPEHIDLLIDASPENQRKVKEALMTLPDQAVHELQDDDLVEYSVVRVADEFVIDLMRIACGIDFEAARESMIKAKVDDVEIPFATPELLWQLKQTGREKDRLDVLFLRELLRK